MNSKDFIQVLRKVIREEVQVAVRTELNKIGETIVERKMPAPVKQQTRYVDTYKPVSKKPMKQFSNNPLLNEILNDTSMIEPDYTMESLNESIDYRDYSDWPTMERTIAPSMPATVPPVLTDINGNRVNTTQLAQTEAGAAVVNALTKDYSAVLKAAQAKSKIGR